MRAALAIARKDLRLLLRDRVAIFWAAVFPTVFAILFGAVLGRGAPPRVTLAVVDSFPTELSRAAIAGLASSGLDVREVDAGGASSAVRRGEAVASVSFPARLEEPVELVIDPSRALEAVVVRAAVSRALAGPGPNVKESTIAGGGRAAGTRGGAALPAAILWGLIGCAGTFAIAIVGERVSGTELRLRAAPVSRVALLGGKGVACFAACAVDAALLVLLGRLAFGVPLGSPGALAIAVIAAAACFTGITLFVGSIGKTEQSTAGAGWGSLLFLAMLGGAMVPLSAMPPWMQTLGEASPVRWGIVAIEAATFRDLPLADIVVPCAKLACLGVVAFALGLIATRRNEAS